MTTILFAVLLSSAPAIPSAHDAAWAESLKTGKPIVVWVGGNFCDRCVDDSKNEFVHVFVNGWQGHPGPATVVCVPHDGDVYRAATVEKWTVGTHDWGHVPSARRVVAEWRRRAAVGNLAPLPLLNFGDGSWGWPADRQSLPSEGSSPGVPASRAGVISRAPFRMSGGGRPVPARSFSSGC